MHYVLSDIHGNERRFASIMQKIRLQQEDTLYVLGDVVDRHPGGIRILETIMGMPNATMLLGNHEYMMLRALGMPYDDNVDDGGALAHWYRNGGKVTHDHFLRLPERQQQEILSYLLGLPLSFSVTVAGRDYRLVHAMPAESYHGDPKYKNAIHFAVWKRMEVGEAFTGGGTLVFGHTTTRHYQDANPMEVWFGKNCIGIDCGSGYPEAGENGWHGRLACLRLEDGTVFYSGENA